MGTHGEKLKEHRERIDKHKMYLMHIAQEADLVKHNEDQVTRITGPATCRRAAVVCTRAVLIAGALWAGSPC